MREGKNGERQSKFFERTRKKDQKIIKGKIKKQKNNGRIENPIEEEELKEDKRKYQKGLKKVAMLEKYVEELKDRKRSSTEEKRVKREREQKEVLEEKSGNKKQINSIQQRRFSMRLFRVQ